MSTAVPALTYAESPPSAPVRTLLTRDYLGFSQPSTTQDRWLAPPTPTATLIINTGAAFGGLPQAFAAGLTDTYDVIEQYGAIECVDLKLTPSARTRCSAFRWTSWPGRWSTSATCSALPVAG